MLTRNGKLVVACGVGLYAAAWGFGTAVMYPVAVGLILAPWLAALWVRTMRRPLRLRRTVQRGDLVEGVDLRIGIEVRTGGGPLPARATLVDQVDGMRPLETPLYRRGAVARGGHLIHSAPRGRYRLSSALVRISDPFWLAETQVAVERVDVVIVYPQVVPLEGLFTDAGSAGGDVNRALLHRSSGYDLHSIRDFQQGESLRRVHWPSTAKRRRLMVKEMHDAPRDEACVLLDGDSSAEVGEPGQSSFDVAVRSAASVLARLVDAGQRCSLIVHGETRQRVRVGSAGIEWADALGVLAVARARAPRPLSAFLGESMTGGADPIDAARVFIVTAGLTPALAERLMALRSAQRDVAVVWIDAATFAGGRTPTGVDAAALRLARSGFALTRVRSGDDLRMALSAPALRVVANA